MFSNFRYFGLKLGILVKIFKNCPLKKLWQKDNIVKFLPYLWKPINSFWNFIMKLGSLISGLEEKYDSYKIYQRFNKTWRKQGEKEKNKEKFNLLMNEYPSTVPVKLLVWLKCVRGFSEIDHF